MIKLAAGAAFVLVAMSASPVLAADVRCVQEGLAALGFSPGPADGALGKRTVRAATIFAANAKIELPPLDQANSEQWCTAITAFAATPAAATISPLDVTSPPDGVLSERETKRQWDMYKTAGECFKGPDIAPGVGIKLELHSAEQFSAGAWSSPFTSVAGASQCRVTAGSLTAPRPIVKVTLDEAYGERVFDMDTAAQWFRWIATYLRYSRDPVAQRVLKDAVLTWARGDALSSGIRVSWGARPVDYQVMATILSILNATAEISAGFSPQERAEVGPWLEKLIAQSAASYWADRQDNKTYMRAYMTMVWGLTTGDNAAIQSAIDVYKNGIHDMRPDGSWPVDSQRGGMGLLYNSASTGHLVMIAMALQQNRGLDLFGYEVDGRSIHDAVDFVVSAVKDPGGVNSKYAIACPGGGDRFGTITEPSMFFIEEGAGYLTAYADRFPNLESSRFIAKELHVRLSNSGAMDTEKEGGAPACQFAPVGGDVKLEPLTMPEPPPALPKAKFEVRTTAEIESAFPQDTNVDAHLRSNIKGGKKGEAELDFNVQGSFNYKQGKFPYVMKIIIGTQLSDKAAAAFKSCGANLVNWDGKERLVIHFREKDNRYVAEGLECITDNATGPVAFHTRFLTENFTDIAIGMVESGSVHTIVNEGLKTFMLRVALGELTVTK